MNRDKVDWKAVRRDTFARAKGAQTLPETYVAVRFALKQLGDHHSFLLLTPELKKKEREYKHNQSNEKTSQESGKGSTIQNTPSRFTQRHTPTSKLIELKGHKIGLLVVPRYWGTTLTPEAKTFAKLIRDQISELEKQNVEAWILDLRGNTGGNMWPMLSGLGPLLAAEEFGYFVGPNFKTAWIYKDGGVGTHVQGMTEHIALRIPEPPPQSHAPIAVLIDNNTASSGEAVAVAFKGRPNTRFFGSKTFGVSTANAGFPLSDGAILELTVSIDADRKGQTYPDGVSPDETISETTPINTNSTYENDTAINAALKWLLSVT